jgi:hypothetical protein
VTVVLVPVPPPPGVGLYSQVGGSGGGGGGDGGAEGGWQVPSQSTMYSTYTRWPSYGFSSTCGVADVTNVYVLSGLRGNITWLAHSKKPRASIRASPLGAGLHLPCTFSPLTVVLITYSSSAS